MDSPRKTAKVRCGSCGRGEARPGRERKRPRVYQIIVACASCGCAYAALSRN